MKKEKWMPVLGYEGLYEISNLKSKYSSSVAEDAAGRKKPRCGSSKKRKA